MINPLKSEIAALFAKGVACERSGDIPAAQTVYQRVLELDKRNVEALTLLGLMAIRANTPFSGIPYFEKALKIKPKSPEHHNNLAMLYLHVNRPDKAEPHALFSYKINPDSAEVLKILFKCYYELGKAKKAQSYINKALALQPDSLEFKLDQALCYDTNSEPDKAKVIFQQLIDSGHRNASVYDGLVRVQKFKVEPPEYQQIKTLLLDPKTPTDEILWLNRDAGKIADDLGRYDEAFQFFAASKSVQHANVKVNAFAASVKTMKEIITPEFFSGRRDFAFNNKRPIFVFGMPRSGTTLVEQILASLPCVYGANELTFFRDQITRLSFDNSSVEAFVQSLTHLTRREAKEIAQDYLKLLAAYSHSAERVVDKMPANFEVLWLLALLFPQARFIHCRRHPIATCVSVFMRPVKDGMPLDALGRYYRLYHELMQHWHAVLPVNILDVDYEAHIQDPENQARRFIAHAGLEWDAACLRFHELKRDVRTPSRRQVEQPIYTSSIDSWRRYEKHLGPLMDALGDLARN